MKKLLFSTAAAALVAAVAAPAAHAQSVRFGLKAGANLSNLSGDLVQQDQYKNRFGFQGGAIVNLGLVADDFLAIQLEALYSQKGFKYADQQYTFLNNTIRNTGNVRYDYIDIPLLLRLKTGGIFFEAGPQYSYLLNISNNRTQTLNGNTVNSVSSNTSDLDRVRRNELGYAAGLGFQSESGFLLGLRYNGAFTDFAKDGYSSDEFRNARNSAFQAYVGFMLGGK
jgi:opacity protein-like surface antigen